MSVSKNYYERFGWGDKTNVESKQPILEIGKQFKIEKANKKVDIGKWGIVDNSNVPFYNCRRVLKNGSFAPWSVSNERTFSEEIIYNNL